MYKRILRTKNVQQIEILYDDFKRYRNYNKIFARKSKTNHYHKFIITEICAKHRMILNLLLTLTKHPRKVLTAYNKLKRRNQPGNLEWISKQFPRNEYTKNKI